MPPSSEAGILGNRSLTFAELDRQFAAGARIVSRSAGTFPAGQAEVPLFAVARDGRLSIAADGRPPDVRSGDTVIVLVRVRASDAEAESLARVR